MALVVDSSLSGQRVASEPDTLVVLCGWPFMIVSDSGAEPTSQTILQ